MPAFVYQVTLTSDASFSASSNTSAPETLEYLPGAALLGALASTAYGTDESTSWERFHSGHLRFGVGLPVSLSGMTVPMPKCLFQPKGSAKKELFNAVRKNSVEGQPKFLTEHFLNSDGTTHEVRIRSSLRTKLDNGVADDGKLYGLHSLEAGTSFIGLVSADSTELLEFAKQGLTGTIRIGRSRNAELGAARFQPLGVEWVEHGGAQDSAVAVFLALSDVALRGTAGEPRLQPDGKDVGLDGWEFDPRKSALRTRRYSPYNGHRARPDLSREVIEAGSVFVFANTKDPKARANRSAIAARLGAGVGEHRAEGLGQLWFEPEPLRHESVGKWETIRVDADVPTFARPSGSLANWLIQREERSLRRDALYEAARELGHRLRGIPPSQWAELVRLVGVDGDTAKLETHLKSGVRQHIWRYHHQVLVEAVTKQEKFRAEFLALVAMHARHASAENRR